MHHLSFFGLTEDPFKLTPDRDFYFPSASHTAVSEVVRFGLQQGEGFLLLIGEVGTGKTILLRYMMNEIQQQFETALLLSPQLTPRQLLLAILQDVGHEEKSLNRCSLDKLLRVLNDYLFALSTKGKKLVIIIDEAQNLPDQSIEQLRLLSNFESDKQKRLQIVLIGQPELQTKIESPQLRQLLQRVTIMETLTPLSKEEMGHYIHFRLSKAGRGDLRVGPAARKLLWRYTHGVPRLVNKFMSRSLLVAYANQKQIVDCKILREAALSMRCRKPFFGKLRMTTAIATSALFIFVFWFMQI